jgi:UDP-N-acetyl-D-mannosaminuronic acid dehydrogenase
VCVVGGGGHVGLPLALTFAEAGFKTLIYDTNGQTVEKIRRGEMPFAEEGAPDLLRKVLAGGGLEVRETPEGMEACRFVVLVIGTPVDQHLTPSFSGMRRAIEGCSKYLRDGQIVVLRSTIFPGISEFIERDLAGRGLDIRVAFCPERVAQGQSLREIRHLPQIVSAFDAPTLEAVKELFGRFVHEFIEMTPMEAELCKLMTNATRYIQFAIANQFYTIAREQGLDFNRILHGCRHNYPDVRNAGSRTPRAHLLKTRCSCRISRNRFRWVIPRCSSTRLPPARGARPPGRRPLPKIVDSRHGVKAESMIRATPELQPRNLLALETARVICTDPYVPDPTLAVERVGRPT